MILREGERDLETYLIRSSMYLNTQELDQIDHKYSAAEMCNQKITLALGKYARFGSIKIKLKKKNHAETNTTSNPINLGLAMECRLV